MAKSRRQRIAGFGTAIVLGCAGVAKADCPPDWNGDNMVSVQDIFDFLEDWFGGNADYNGADGTTLQDLFDFLAGWFAGCTFGPTVSASPSTGGLGTVVTLSLSPAISPNVFDAQTTLMWAGRYVPTVGSASQPFQVSFSAADVLEVSSSEARIVIGTDRDPSPQR